VQLVEPVEYDLDAGVIVGQVTVDFSPLRSGRPGGALRLLTFADGRTLKTARTNPPPGSPAELAAPGPAK
jgi:hypothetical protein